MKAFMEKEVIMKFLVEEMSLEQCHYGQRIKKKLIVETTL